MHLTTMDYVRYILALGVIVAHFNSIADTQIYWPVSSATAVGCFFGLSGFLVYASYLRRPHFWDYLMSRARRILPIYILVVLLAAIGLFFLSNRTFSEYFFSLDFWKYLGANLTFLNFLHPTLPGVFEDLPISAVNGSLWTLKVEWMLYLSIPLFFYVVRRFKVNIVAFIAVICVLSVGYKMLMNYEYALTGREIFHILSYQVGGQLVYFYTGVLFYYCSHHLPKCILPLSIASVVVLLIINFVDFGQGLLPMAAYDLLYPFASVWVVMWLCCWQKGNAVVPRIGNYSYEMYLFHFPIIQTACALHLLHLLPPYATIALTLIVIFLLSFASSRLIEAWKK